MKTYTFYKHKLLIIPFLVLLNSNLIAQKTDSLFTRIPTDTSKNKLSMDAVYSRPFLKVGKMPEHEKLSY